MDRRNNDRDDRRSPSPPRNPNVFDDEYALDPDEDDFMPSVSDGFRPTGTGLGDHNATNNSDRQDHDRSASPRPTLMTTKSQENDLRRFASRNSTMKPTGGEHAAGHENRHFPGTHTRGASSQATTGLQHRESISSTGSFATMARSESPFTTGPSHPYGMYPQTTVARSPSVTTSSTQPPNRSLSLSRPTHPYGMYTQNVVEDEDQQQQPSVPAGAVPTAIPVGFPGLNTGYHRRYGPDGEEQDIVGPDGHAEQLPPYTRYPTEGPTKAALVAEANATPVEPTSPINAFDDSRAITTPVSPVSPLQPSPPPLRLPQSRDSLQRRSAPAPPPAPLGTLQSETASQSTEQPLSEKEDTSKQATNWRRKKLWGRLPMGVAALLLVIVLIFAIILGTAIGTFVSKNKDKDDQNRPPKHDKDHEEPSPQISASSRSLFDATPIPTPSSLPPLPVGSFALPLGIAQESSPSCLTMANQLSAWSCKMSFAPQILTINNTEGKGSRPLVSMEAFSKPDGGIQYGVQPPIIPDQPIPMRLVLDLDYKAYGPAFHFDARYDKVVVLSEDEFMAGMELGARQERPSGKPGYRHRFQVQPGDEPWFCIWNKTYIEGYIYAQDNSSAATFSAFPTAWPTQAPAETAGGPVYPVETGPPSQGTAILAEETPIPTPVKRRRRGDGDYPRYAPYPRIVKIEERRLPDAPQPYCQKMRLMDNGQIVPLTKQDQVIKVMLQEDDPSFDEFFSASAPIDEADKEAMEERKKRFATLSKRRDPPGACHCQWMFQ